MKVRLFSLLMAASSLVFASCGNETGTNTSNNTASENGATTDHSTAGGAQPGTAASAASPVQEIVDHYLHVKNALFNDNGAEAANGAKALVASMEKVDVATFNAEQKKTYDEVAEDLKEHAEHTVSNAGKIDHQREHFIMMSDNIHELVKTFGASKTLYVDHCPMANNNKGANWISETEEIKNPYMGQKMPKCGKMEQVIKQQ